MKNRLINMLTIIAISNSQLLFSEVPFAKNGMVVSAHKLASEAGVEIMKKGGNAVDAAVATGFALAVVYPAAGNIGGGGFMTAVVNGKKFTLDFREMAPGLAHRDMYLDDSSQVISGLSLYSHLATGVPGTVHGLIKACMDHGSGQLSLWQVLKPAIRLAERGFPISNGFARSLNYRKEFFRRDMDTDKIFNKKNGKDWEAGDILKQKSLAGTLRRIARTMGEDFYLGKTANLIVNEMENHNGFITMEDLKNYQSVYRDPILGDFLEYEILSMGPPSSGGLVLIHMLNMLEQFELESMGWNSSQYVHLLTEVERRGYADRAEHLGDIDFWDVPVQMFLSDDYAKQRISSINQTKTTSSSEISHGEPYPFESRETTHYSVVDKDGNAVSVTTTLNTGFGSGFNDSLSIHDYLFHVRRILKLLGKTCFNILDQDGINIIEPDGGFYLFPVFRLNNTALNFESSNEFCKLLLNKSGVASLPGSDFNRIQNEISCRLAYVNFNGTEALQVSKSVGKSKELTKDDLQYTCKNVWAGLNKLTEFL